MKKLHFSNLFLVPMKPVAVGLALLAQVTSGHAQTAFTPGNLVVTRIGDPTATTAQSGANALFLEEYTRAGVFVQRIALPVTTTANNYQIVSAGPKLNADGLIDISPNRRTISIIGYQTSVGMATNAQPSATVPRMIAVIDSSANINTANAFTDVANSQAARNAIYDNVSGNVYLAGGGGTGLRFAPLATTPTTTTSTLVSTTPNLRKMGIYNGNLYFTNNVSGSAKVYMYIGIPGAGATETALPGIDNTATTSIPTGFVLFDVNPAVAGSDLLYLIEETSSTTSNIKKYTYNGTTWTDRGSFAINGLNENTLKDFAGTLERRRPVLYAVSYSGMVRLIDSSAAYSDNINMSQTIIMNNTAVASNISAYRGISFVPGTRDTLINPTGSLPLNFMSFTGRKEKETINLLWATASERGNDRFEILRAADGKTFIQIGTVRSTNGSSATNNYTFSDDHPLTGNNYYQLRQVDFDGRSTVSPIVLIKNEAKKLDFSVIGSNGNSGQLAVSVYAATAVKATLQILDFSGKKIVQYSLNLAGGNQVSEIAVPNLPKGMYIARLITGKEISSKTFRN